MYTPFPSECSSCEAAHLTKLVTEVRSSLMMLLRRGSILAAP